MGFCEFPNYTFVGSLMVYKILANISASHVTQASFSENKKGHPFHYPSISIINITMTLGRSSGWTFLTYKPLKWVLCIKHWSQPFQLPWWDAGNVCIREKPKALTDQISCPGSLRADPVSESRPISRVLSLSNMVIIFLSGESHGQGSLAGYSPWGHRESDTTEVTAPCKSIMNVSTRKTDSSWKNSPILWSEVISDSCEREQNRLSQTSVTCESHAQRRKRNKCVKSISKDHSETDESDRADPLKTHS